MTHVAEQPWYREGLKFDCTGCGDCCGGAPGYVWVGLEEIQALADALGLSAAEFEAQYVRQVHERKSLLERPDGDCVFLDPETRRCRVYAARPLQCRTWPFWASNLRSPMLWRAVCRVCPGAGRGRLYSLEDIRTQAERVIV
jgi:Fe-S-cluster containining protein